QAQTGKFDEVEERLWELVMEKHPLSPVILEALGNEYARSWRFNVAASAFVRWSALEPKNTRALAFAGLAFEQLGAREMPLKNYRKAVELAPERWQVRLRLAHVLLEQADPAAARPHLE